MYIVLDRFGCILQFIIPYQVDFSTCIGVAVCGCHIYYNLVLNNMDNLALIKSASHYASEADDITFVIIYDMERINPFFVILVKFCTPKINPPSDLLRF